MSVHVEWDSEDKTAIVWSFLGRWTWGEVDDAGRNVAALLDQVNHTVDLILDVSHMSILPPDVITRVKSHYLEKPPKVARLILVGADANLRLFWDTFTELPYAAHYRAHYCETLAEARQFVRGESGA